MSSPDLDQTAVLPAVPATDPFTPPDSYFPSASGDPVSAVPTLPDALAPTAGPPPDPDWAPGPAAGSGASPVGPESPPALPYPPPVSTPWGPGLPGPSFGMPLPPEPPIQVEPPTQVVPLPPPAGHPTTINCPVCGALGQVDPTRRDAEDFCAHCDFPLFWAKDRIPLAEPAAAGDDSLRRLPGALGRQVIASVPCPHCNELNLPSASVCVRCGLSMHYVPPPPPAPPRALPPPVERPIQQDEPEDSERLWIWWVVLISVFVLAGIGLVLAQHWY